MLCFFYLKKIVIIIKLKVKSLNIIEINKILLFIFYNKSYINKLKRTIKYNNQFYNTYYLKMLSNTLKLYYQFLKQIR